MSESNRTSEEIISISVDEISTDLGNVLKKTIITETTTKKFEAVGEVLKPITTTTIITEIEEVENKNQSIKKAIEENTFDLSSFDSLSLDKETEGMEVVEEIVGGITGALFGNMVQYIIGAIFLVILIFFISKLFRKKN